MKIKIILVGSLISLLVGCANGITPGKEEYIGSWKSSTPGICTIFSIFPSGDSSWYAKTPSSLNKLNQVISEINDDEIKFLFTSFEINNEPTLNEGNWQMTIDGNLLTKKKNGYYKLPKSPRDEFSAPTMHTIDFDPTIHFDPAKTGHSNPCAI